MPFLKRTSYVFFMILFLSMILIVVTAVSAEPLRINAALGMDGDADTVLINGTGIFLTTGDSWDFYQGYSLNVKSVNQDQKQVWVKLLHDGELLQDDILSEGDIFVYSKNTEIMNITVDTIYISPGGELITFKPIYQYLDEEYPEPELEETMDNSTQEEEQNSTVNPSSMQTNGFSIFQAFACISAVILCRIAINR
ncbi:S-layer protein domain-containing protein [Methanolobus sp.]|uniref:S-layer protein domain-containing protein n=1 Tax=Methanolobus sp. TaxID=1874737 RepID=UPI002585D684|nr:S-layer protein domain-containing protein [Methanolobus sp.]